MDATEGLKPPAVPETSPPILTNEQVATLLSLCRTPRRGSDYSPALYLARRDEVMIRLFIDTGVRVSELANADVDDVDPDREILYVANGKGGKQRAVPFGAMTGQCVDRYLRIRALHPAVRRSCRFLIGQRGPLGPEAIRARFRLLGARAGIEGLHPHMFRHLNAHLGCQPGDRSVT